MQTTLRRPYVLDFHLFRWLARASAVVLLAVWLAFVIGEAVRVQFDLPSASTIYQAVALAIVFAGCAIGWRKELAGGVIAILGTIAFFVVHALTLDSMPHASAAWFAAPGILFLAAWYVQKTGWHVSPRH
jgi:hypothetical protein